MKSDIMSKAPALGSAQCGHSGAQIFPAWRHHTHFSAEEAEAGDEGSVCLGSHSSYVAVLGL